MIQYIGNVLTKSKKVTVADTNGYFKAVNETLNSGLLEEAIELDIKCRLGEPVEFNWKELEVRNIDI